MRITMIPPESEFITALIDGWEYRRSLVRDGHAEATAADRLLEDRRQLATLVDALFWTSLSAEEGRPVRGSVCICSPAQAPRSRRLSRGEPLTTKSLTALLTASPDASIAAHFENGLPSAWGFLDSRPMHALTIRIADAGTIVGLSGPDTVALFHGGNVHVTAQTSATDLALLLAKALERQAAFPERLALAGSLVTAIIAMHSHHHGGAIVIGPASGEQFRSAIDLRYTYTPDAASALPRQLEQLEAVRHADPEVLDAHVSLLKQTLRTLGRLTAIDGALVLRDDLTVLGFGGKLKFESADFTVSKFNVITGESLNDQPVADLGGMRHQSAARFVHQNRDCSVVVSSQDGRLTLFSWVQDPGGVAAISGLEHLVWGELP